MQLFSTLFPKLNGLSGLCMPLFCTSSLWNDVTWPWPSCFSEITAKPRPGRIRFIWSRCPIHPMPHACVTHTHTHVLDIKNQFKIYLTSCVNRGTIVKGIILHTAVPVILSPLSSDNVWKDVQSSPAFGLTSYVTWHVWPIIYNLDILLTFNLK